ncbi:hypothetical protein [Caminibacter pacificus]
MGNKERIQKELDLFLEKLKFWRYVIFAIVSGVIGVIFSLSQNKIHINFSLILLLVSGFLGVVISIKRIDVLTKEYEELLEILEKEE